MSAGEPSVGRPPLYRRLTSAGSVALLLVLAAFVPWGIWIVWSTNQARAAIEELRHSAEARAQFRNIEHPDLPDVEPGEDGYLAPLASEIAERRLVPLGESALRPLLDLYWSGAAEDMRYAVVLGLRSVRSPRSVDALLEIADKDESATVRARAIEALGEQGDPRALRGLLVLSEKLHPHLSGQCYDALEAITGWQPAIEGEGGWRAAPVQAPPGGGYAGENPLEWVPKTPTQPPHLVWQDRLIQLRFLTPETAPFPDEAVDSGKGSSQ